ncbi:MAG TPA: hypothetical protein VFF77_00505, partial [Holophagaceae bacterium]|nr:hypothetical protein [Holophagaceae bacterium]
EGWLTELDDDALRRLVSLDSDTEVMDEEENGGRADGAAAKVREASKLEMEVPELPEEVRP